jgi:proteasome lid subunit RPN8/RPN11/molybdopterin converting factor small subunit
LTLWFDRSELERMQAHARDGYPHEVVGLLAGRPGTRVVSRVSALVNERADSPRNRYQVSGLVVAKAERQLEALGFEVLGYYHSHPDHEARYSDFDRDHAMPNLSYVIVAVRGDGADPNTASIAELLSWRLREDRAAMDPESLRPSEAPRMATIHIPTPLRPYTGGQASVQVVGRTVGEALAALTQSYEGLARHLRDDQGRLRSFVNVYLGDEDIRFLQKEDTVLTDNAEITIVPSIAGGS